MQTCKYTEHAKYPKSIQKHKPQHIHRYKQTTYTHKYTNIYIHTTIYTNYTMISTIYNTYTHTEVHYIYTTTQRYKPYKYANIHKYITGNIYKLYKHTNNQKYTIYIGHANIQTIQTIPTYNMCNIYNIYTCLHTYRYTKVHNIQIDEDTHIQHIHVCKHTHIQKMQNKQHIQAYKYSLCSSMYKHTTYTK